MELLNNEKQSLEGCTKPVGRLVTGYEVPGHSNNPYTAWKAAHCGISSMLIICVQPSRLIREWSFPTPALRTGLLVVLASSQFYDSTT